MANYAMMCMENKRVALSVKYILYRQSAGLRYRQENMKCVVQNIFPALLFQNVVLSVWLKYAENSQMKANAGAEPKAEK